MLSRARRVNPCPFCLSRADPYARSSTSLLPSTRVLAGVRACTLCFPYSPYLFFQFSSPLFLLTGLVSFWPVPDTLKPVLRVFSPSNLKFSLHFAKNKPNFTRTIQLHIFFTGSPQSWLVLSQLGLVPYTFPEFASILQFQLKSLTMACKHILQIDPKKSQIGIIK